MEVYSDSLFVPVNPTDPPQNPVSTTEGSVWGPRQALTGGVVLGTGKVTVYLKGTVGVTPKNIALDIQIPHTEPRFSLCISLPLCVYSYTDMMPYYIFFITASLCSNITQSCLLNNT